MASVHTVMPGSFSFDAILPPKLDINVGAKSHFFQPPLSASSSLHKSTASLSPQNVTATTKRKRSRHDSHLSHQPTPIEAPSHASPSLLPYTPSRLDTSTSLSPAPFVNTQYRLAGGLDTPTARQAMEAENLASPELYLRGGAYRGLQSLPDSYFPQSDPLLSRESNGRSGQQLSPRIQDGLGKAVYGMASVAGKVWNFCRTTAFKVRTSRSSCLEQSMSDSGNISGVLFAPKTSFIPRIMGLKKQY